LVTINFDENELAFFCYENISRHKIFQLRRFVGKAVVTDMKKIVWLGLLVVGIVLIVFGVQAMNSLEGEASRFFRGTPTDRSMWMLVGGSLCALAGVYGIFKKG
jgi:hypothetical protein